MTEDGASKIDEDLLKKEVKKIARGGFRNFVITTNPDKDKGCQPVCDSVHVTKGCTYGYVCKVIS